MSLEACPRTMVDGTGLSLGPNQRGHRTYTTWNSFPVSNRNWKKTWLMIRKIWITNNGWSNPIYCSSSLSLHRKRHETNQNAFFLFWLSCFDIITWSSLIFSVLLDGCIAIFFPFRYPLIWLALFSMHTHHFGVRQLFKIWPGIYQIECRRRNPLLTALSSHFSISIWLISINIYI